MANDELISIMTTLSPAPEATIQILNCRCAKEQCSTNPILCRKAELLCTDLCRCSEDDECENQQGECDDDHSDIEDEEDDDV